MNAQNKVLTVTILNEYIKTLFDREPFFQSLLIEGEISNYKRNISGHLYFTLKDEESQVSCVMFKSKAMGLTFEPSSGMKVLIKGTVSLYPKGGTYQIYVEDIKESGLGELYIKYEELKKKLFNKGYFDQDHKKKLPKFPKNIALLTSNTGAVIEDLKSIILKRSQFSNLTLYPTKVQGSDAKYSIIENIRKANENDEIDVIILARGGGSIEDLWPFNEEEVADAIYSSVKPIISAVGHETDFTISDFVSDLRAATPSDAALMVVRDNIDLKNELDSLTTRLNLSYTNNLKHLTNKVDSLAKSEVFNKEKLLIRFNQNLISLTNKLDLLSPREILNKHKEKVKDLSKHLDNAYSILVSNNKNNYLIMNEKLNLLNPMAVLNKGYSITYLGEKVVRDESEVNVGDTITTKLKNGEIKSKVIKED
ncbi:MAG: exodeoxyribonuclease VII large subunit [Gammaproteobacteria bacterium]|nr:exodeoxyribonuclease VII large subunit [Gammaproteobacteria bacterium]